MVVRGLPCTAPVTRRATGTRTIALGAGTATRRDRPFRQFALGASRRAEHAAPVFPIARYRPARTRTLAVAPVRGGKAALLVALAALVFAFFFFDLGRYLELSHLKAQQAHIQAYAAAHPVQSAAAFFAAYVTIAALSLPAAALLTLLGGAVFGFLLGTVLCSFAATAGATIAFLVARFLLRDAVLARFGDSLGPINRGIEKDGAFYLFTLRMVPLFPFFVVNLAMALTPIRAFTYAWVSQVGMLAGTAVYVNAGTQLARIESLDGILSPALIGSFVLLGVFPWVARRGLEWIRKRRDRR